MLNKDKEEKFHVPKTQEQLMKDALEFLDKAKESVEEFRFNFACFVDAFKRSLKDEKERN